LSANIAKLQFLMMILFGGAQRGIVWLPNSSVEDTLGTGKLTIFSNQRHADGMGEGVCHQTVGPGTTRQGYQGSTLPWKVSGKSKAGLEGVKWLPGWGLRSREWQRPGCGEEARSWRSPAMRAGV